MSAAPAAIVSLSDAVAGVAPGSLITLGGFQLNRAPMALLGELVRQGRRDLRVVTPPNPLGLDLLVGAGLVSEATFGFIGFQYEDGFVVAPAVKRAIETGTLRFRERDVYEIVQGLRAAAMGLPFLPAPGGEGSDYRRVNGTATVVDPETGEAVPVAAAIRPDLLLVHAQEADRDGNLAIADPYAEALQARAAGRVIATAERLVDRVERPSIPGTLVERLAIVPEGAFPTSCHGFYPYAVEAIRKTAGGSGAAPAATAGDDRLRAADRLVTGLARAIKDGETVATGVASALPMLAVALARRTHAPRLTYLNCVGAIDPHLDGIRPTSTDVTLLDRCRGRVDLPDLFDRAHRGGIDVMFFGAAQVDREARINLTCIGEYARPRVKLPGPAGSPSMRSFVRRAVIAVPRHSPRSLVERVDFTTAARGARNRETLVITDRAVLRLDGDRLRVETRHAGTGAAELERLTGFTIDGSGPATPEPSPEEMAALRSLDPQGLRARLV
ncbi:MAG: CoA-transferase [Candidatus Polarisedimenticolia bacterium]